MENITEQITKLQDKAAKYDNLKERYDKYNKKLEEAANILNDIRNEINPYLSMSDSKHGKRYPEFKEYLAELYEKMTAGLEVSTSLIETTYGLPYEKALYLFMKLKTKSRVMSRKDGKKAYLYIQKEV